MCKAITDVEMSIECQISGTCLHTQKQVKPSHHHYHTQ